MPEPASRSTGASALVLAAGHLPPAAVAAKVVDQRRSEGARVVAVDGGLVHAQTLDLDPDLIVGDFDSVPPALLAGYPASIVRRFPSVKNQLDLELALDAVIVDGAHAISVLGAFGGRFDQSLAALLIAARLQRTGLRLDLHGADHSAWPLSAGTSVTLDVAAGTTVSVVALEGDAVVSSAGLAYPLAELVIPFGSGLGVSNAALASSATVTCVAGLIAVVVEH